MESLGDREAVDLTILDPFRQGWALGRRNFGPEIYFFAPAIKHYETEEYSNQGPPRFVPISITGQTCALQCDHCQGRILRGMAPAASPDKLLATAATLAQRGTQGILVSGGSQADGMVPLKGFLPALQEIKERYRLQIIVHLGLVDEALAAGLAEARVDAAMLDVIGCDQTIREVYHLEATPVDYAASLRWLTTYGVETVPHVVIGLHYGRIAGEREALRIISQFPVASLVLVGLLPLYDTPMEGITPPSPEEMGELFLQARLLFPHTPVLLGCERPAGEHKGQTDLYALKAGLNGIAYPAEGIVGAAQDLGLQPIFSPWCCSLIFQMKRDEEIIAK
ncbi:MAG: radical SAM protein [Candidatus Tectomicrobia bacterium]|uniref:Radical SAM protein n=1 Tax=Tectimicrobiota bacterium TaxID=2528274 RepID=A0A932CN81_UNCTE|nr:radical SAM protein [Candidatus Tectomicrobia bacterium]